MTVKEMFRSTIFKALDELSKIFNDIKLQGFETQE